jgi:hypothetical protein
MGIFISRWQPCNSNYAEAVVKGFEVHRRNVNGQLICDLN